MKVSQIVSEHKKGVRAMKYAKKPQNTIAPKKPQKQTVQPGDKVDEGAAIQGEIVANDGKTITVAMPDGTQIQKPIAAAINKDAQGKATFNVLTPTAPGSAPTTPQTPEQEFQRGQRIDINTGSDSTATMGEGMMSELDQLYDDWMNSEYTPFDSDSGDYNEVARKAASFLQGQIDPKHIEDAAVMFSQRFHGEDEEQLEETPPTVQESADTALLQKILSIAGVK